MKKSLTAIFAILSMTLNVDANTGSAAHSSDKIEYDNYDYSSFGRWASDLGMGFNYKSNQFTNYTCVDGQEIKPTGKPESNIDFSMEVSSDSLKKELGIGADFRTVAGAGELSGAAKFLKASTEDAMSITLNYVGTIMYANRFFKADSPNKEGLKVAQLPSLLQKKCGQGFVQQIYRGAKLFFSIRFEFMSRDDKESFAAELHYKSPMTSINFDAKKNDESISSRARVKISAYQLGGEVEKLAFVFSGAPNRPAKPVDAKLITVDGKESAGDAQSSFTFINCSFGVMNDCKKALANAIDYATKQDWPDSFPNQVTSKAPGDKENNNLLANLGYLIIPYRFTEFVEIPGLDSAVEEQKKTLYAALMDNVDNLNQILNLKTGPISYTTEQQDGFAKAEKALRERQVVIIDASKFCFQQDEINCGAKVDEMNSKIKAIAFDESVLKPIPVTYAQFCYAAHAAEQRVLDRSTRESVFAILEILKGRTDLPSVGGLNYDSPEATFATRCEILNRYLEKQTVIDLSYSGQNLKIKTLEVIKNLKNVERLVVKNQDVVELDPLTNFSQLSDLDLDGNEIRDVTPLSKITNLSRIHLAGNKLRTVAPLNRLPNLTFLDVRKNLPTMTCISSPSLQQCLLARSKWMVDFISQKNTEGLSVIMGQSTRVDEGAFISGLRETNGFASTIVAMMREDQFQSLKATPGHLGFGRLWNSDVALSGSQVIITGGWPNYSLTSIEVYDTKGGYVVANGTLLHGRAAHTASTLGTGLVLVAGGYSAPDLQMESALSSSELIDTTAVGGPKTIAQIEMGEARAAHTATSLDADRVLLVGGFSNGRGVRSIEIFDRKQMKFTTVGHLRKGRGGHTATRIGDQLLIVGGFADSAGALDSAELIDLKTFQSRYTKSNLNSARANHSVQVLPNGEILVAGGMTKPRVEAADKVAADGFNLFDMLSGSYTFKLATGSTTDYLKCQICLDTVEMYLPQEESFVANAVNMNQKRAGFIVVPHQEQASSLSLRIWGGIDFGSSSTMETGLVTEDPL